MVERHTATLVEKGLDCSVLQTHRHEDELLEGDLTNESIGLTEQQFLEMASSVDIIVYNGRQSQNLALIEAEVPQSFSLATSPHQPAFLLSSSLTALQNGFSFAAMQSHVPKENLYVDSDAPPSAYTDFIKSSENITGHQIVHLVHPRPVLWRDLAQIIAQELDLPVAPFGEWLKALHALMGDSGTELKTLAKTAPLVDSTGVPIMDMTNALRLSPTLRDPALTRLDRTLVQNWLRHWGLIKSISSPKRQHLARL
ncbi:hypothetical protein BKA70DRAFT_1515491 [Coprinopsis sp. MPI-PUGE-AT-0042]|nr:hypothetical protein BKA70DRAFT_1515491 [Coprinopsis sp. MPI-PUGE-AT-0042]